MNEKNIDNQLNEAGQRAIQNMVASLPEDVPSLAWRSSLNAEVRAVAAKRKRKLVWFRIASPALGLAAALSIMFVAQKPQPIATPVSLNSSQLQATLIKAHTEAVSQDLANSDETNLTDFDDVAKS